MSRPVSAISAHASLRSPRSAELAARYRAQIASGALRPGDQLPSFGELRGQGYGQATVEKVLKELEGEGLVQRAHGKGVFVAASRPRAARTGVVGFLGLRDGSGLHPYWSELFLGAQDALQARGYDVLLIKDPASTRWERLEGVLTFGYGELMLLKQRPLTMPGVGVMATLAHIPCVEINEAAAIALAVRHLVQLGHRRIGYLHIAENCEGRVAAYRQALQSSGIKPNAARERRFANHNFPGPSSFADANYAAMTEWLQQDWAAAGCTALLAWNDDAAFGVLRALREAGIAVPDALSVVGFDGSPAALYCTPGLTTLEVPLREMGAASANLLLQQIHGEAVPPASHVFQAALRVAGSTAPPATKSKGPQARSKVNRI